MYELPTPNEFSIDMETVTTGELRKKGVVLIQRTFYTEGHIHRVSDREHGLYMFFCVRMRIEDFIAEVEWGKMEEYVGCDRRGVGVALRGLAKKRLISILSTRLVDDRDPRKDVLTIRIWRLRDYGNEAKTLAKILTRRGR